MHEYEYETYRSNSMYEIQVLVDKLFENFEIQVI